MGSRLTGAASPAARRGGRAPLAARTAARRATVARAAAPEHRPVRVWRPVPVHVLQAAGKAPPAFARARERDPVRLEAEGCLSPRHVLRRSGSRATRLRLL